MKRLSLILLLLLSIGASAQRKLTSTADPDNSKKDKYDTEYGKAILNHNRTLLYYIKTYDLNNGKGTVSQSIWETYWNNDQNLNDAIPNQHWNDFNNNGVVGVSNDGNRVYLLGTYSKKARLWPGLSVSEKIGDGWTQPQKVKIDKLHLKSRMFDFHVTPDEGAIFISMGESYFGQIDIYVSQRKADLSWTEPIPLDAINSETTHEISPFFSADFNTLYFASNRGSGIGGFDIYASERGSEWTEWSEPQLLPKPYNSEMFDAYFTAYEKEGAFVISNRGDSLSKIYHFGNYEQAPIEPADTEEEPEISAVNGMLLDEEFDNELSFSEEAVAFAEEAGYTQKQLQKMTPEQLRRLFAEDISLVYNEEDEEAEGEMFTEAEYAFAEEQGYTQKQLQKMSADELKRLFAKDIALNYTEEETETTAVNGMLLDEEFDNELSFSEEAIAFAEEAGYTQKQLQKMTPEQLRRLFAEDISLVYNEEDEEAEGEMFTEAEYAFAEEQGYTQKQLQKMSADELKRLFAKDISLVYNEEAESEKVNESELPPSLAVPLSQNPDISLDFDRFVIEYEDEIPADATAFMTDLKTEDVSSSPIAADGSFKFNRMNRGDDYQLSFSENIETEKVKVYNTYNEERLEVPMSDAGIITLKPQMLYPDITLDVASLSEAIAADYKNNNSVDGHFIYDSLPERDALIVLMDDQNTVVDQTYTDRFGRYKFSSLSPVIAYSVYYVDLNNLYDPELANLRELSEEDLPPSFTAIPLKRTSDIELDFDRFSMKYDDEIPADAKAYMTDVRTAEVSEADIKTDGSFKFDQLVIGDDYQLSFSDNLDKEKIKVYNNQDDQVEELTLSEEGFIAVKPEMIYPDIVLDEAIIAEAIEEGYDNNSSLNGQFIYDDKTRRNVLVVLVDDEDQVLDQTYTDQNGQYEFQDLSSYKSYKALYVDQDDVFDPRLANLQELRKADLPISFAAIPLMRVSDVPLDFDRFLIEYEDELPDGAKAYMTDLNTNKVTTVMIGRDGTFQFNHLNRGDDYQLTFSDNIEPSKTKVYNTYYNAKQEIPISSDGIVALKPEMLYPDIALDVDRLSSALMEDYTNMGSVSGHFLYDSLPERDALIVLMDDQNTVVDQTYTDRFGRFEFSSLSPVINYTVYYVDQNNVYDHEAANLRELSEEDLPPSFTAISLKRTSDIELDFDRFSMKYDDEIPADAKAYMKDVRTAEVSEADIKTDGSFKFDQLVIGDEYQLSFSDNLDKKKIKVYNNQDDHVEELTLSEDGLIAVKPELIYPDIVLDAAIIAEAIADGYDNNSSLRGHFIYDKKTRRNVLVVLVDEEDQVLDQTYTDQNGMYGFDALSSLKSYKALYVDQDDVYDPSLANLRELNESELPPSFAAIPLMQAIDVSLGESGSGQQTNGEELELSFSNSNNVGEENLKEQDEEPFPLTPPKDKNEVSIIVEESIVNNTVFEDAPENEKPKTKMAQASADYGDFRLKDGSYAEVVETRKGWNLHFDFNKFMLSKNQMDYVYQVLIPLLRKNPDLTLILEGHTDSIGSDEVNYRMSILRISNVLYHLEINGIEDTRITVRPKGKTEPIAPNSSEEGRAINRRVEIEKEE